MGEYHTATAEQIRALIALSRQGHRQNRNVRQQDILGYPNYGITLKVLQPKVALEPGKVAFYGTPRTQDRPPPWPDEERRGPLLLSSSPRVVIYGRMRANPLGDHAEKAPVKGGGIGIDYPGQQAKQECYQANPQQPTTLSWDIGRGDGHKNEEAG